MCHRARRLAHCFPAPSCHPHFHPWTPNPHCCQPNRPPCNIATLPILANARQLIKVEIPHQSHFFQMRVCQRAVFAKDRVPSADIYDHCLELRHLPYCHFFAGPLYLLLILHCPHVKGGGRHGAIIKPSAQQTFGMTRLKRAGNASSGRFDIETLKTKQEKSEVRTKQHMC